jgi:hypothetical protein
MTPMIPGVEPRAGAKEWFKKQSEETQRAILGNQYERYLSGDGLVDMVEISNNPTWGNTITIRSDRR